MTKRFLFATAALLLCGQGLSLRAQDAPPAPPAAPLVAAPNASVAAPGVATPPGAFFAPPLAPSAVLAPAPARSLAPPSRPLVAPGPTTALPPLSAAAPMLAPPPPQSDFSVFYVGDNFLGVRAEEITRENMGRYNLSGEPRGVGVREVLKGSPAERAGLRENDVIVRFDGEAVTSVRKLNRLIDESAPEHAARITVRRGGSEQELTVTLGKREMGGLFDDGAWRGQVELSGRNADMLRRQGERAREQAEKWQRNNRGGVFGLSFFGGRRIGVSTNSLSKQLADYFGVSHGVLITSVEANSPAERAGLKAGDVVTEVDGERVDDASDLSRALGRKEEGEVGLTFVRDRKQRTVRVMPEKRRGNDFELTPGAFSIELPRVAVTTPRVNVELPRITVVPRVNITPRARVVAPGRIL